MPVGSALVGKTVTDNASKTMSQHWVWPATAQLKGDPNKPGGQAFWTEPVIEILSCDMNEVVDRDPANGKVLLTEIDFSVPPDQADSGNAGRRPLRQWIRLYKDAYDNADHPRFRSTMFAIETLNRILVALGVDVQGIIESQGQVDYAIYFSVDSEGSCFVTNKRISGILKSDWWNGKKQQSITEYMPADDA